MPVEVKKGTELRTRYVVSDNLGVGAFATVWRATDKQEGRDVAIKRMLKLGGHELPRLLDEATKTSRLKGHKNIVEVYEVFQEDGEGFLVMEYVDGASLETILREHVRAGTWLDPDEALDYFRQVLSGLLFAHSSGLYHRDVKPSNILVSKLGTVKLVDFGLARTLAPKPDEYEHHEPGFAWTGTPNFMSPEQASGEHLDHQTDIFSAGIVGYILLTARHPFNHPSAVVSVFESIKEPAFPCAELQPIPQSGLTDQICRVLTGMLKRDKALRYQSLIQPLNELAREAAQSCPQCGAPNPMSNSFCGQCGSPLRPPPVVPAAAPVSPPQPAPQRTALELTDEGFEHARNDDWAAAITLYRQAIEADPSYARAYSNLGYALNRLGLYGDAIGVLSEGIEKTPNSVLLHRLYDSRGFARSNLKDYDGAIQDFTRALEYTQTNPRVYHHRAESKALAGRYSEAYSDTLLALRFDPFYSPALRLRGKLESQGYVKPLGIRNATAPA